MKTYSQRIRISGEVYFLDEPFIGKVFSNRGDSIEIKKGIFSLIINKASDKINIWFKNQWSGEGRFSINNIPIERDSIFLGKIIIPSMLVLNEKQLDSLRNHLTDSLKIKSLVDEAIKNDFYEQVWVKTMDTPKPQYRNLIKPDTTFRFSGTNYKSKYLFAKPSILCPFDLNNKIVIKYNQTDKTGFVDYMDIMDCKLKKH